MKRIAIIFILLGMTFSGQAQQSDTLPDTCQSRPSDVSLTLGISAGASLHFGNRLSPYYSKYGFLLQLPLLMRWDMSPHWQLGTGLRYDFTWNPLYYNVEFSGTWDDGDARGLQFMQTPTTTTQKAFTYIIYMMVGSYFKNTVCADAEYITEAEKEYNKLTKKVFCLDYIQVLEI